MLVSVIVITYNSSPYVLETLESAYWQTYPDLELIVSDDCSTDNTFALCQEWVSAHASRFRHAICTQTPRNLGIAGNENHALQYVHGTWLRMMGGDDLLKEDCIATFMSHLAKGIHLYFSQAERWEMATGQRYVVETGLPNATARRQFYVLLHRDADILGCTTFVHVATLRQVGGYDERFPFADDVGLAMRFLAHGMASRSIPFVTTTWRKHATSTSDSNPAFRNSVHNLYQHYRRQYYWSRLVFLDAYHDWCCQWINRHYHAGLVPHAVGYILRGIDVVHWKRRLFPHVCMKRYPIEAAMK